MNETLRISVAVILTLAWLTWCVGLYVRHKRAQPKINLTASTLIAYASQSGAAAALAVKKAQQIGTQEAVNLLPLDRVDSQTLQATKQAHFVVSTYGNGEPPDNGQRFYQDMLSKRSAVDLSHLHYSVTALGDSSYEHFCAFGHNLHSVLANLGAKSKADVIELDSQSMQQMASEEQSPHLCDWQLTARQCLNPKSDNPPLYLLTFQVNSELPNWQAGDVISILPCNDQKSVDAWLQKYQLDGSMVVSKDGIKQPLKNHLTRCVLPEHFNSAKTDPEIWLTSFKPLPNREYSVASAHYEGVLKLIVRLQTHTDGKLGIGSGWLTQFSKIGDITQGIIRSNIRCHIENAARPLILIGAGSGVAGLRAQLAQRSQHTKSAPVWLIYGERDPKHDTMINAELESWQQKGLISELHFAYSRDPNKNTYVQDILHINSEKLKAMVHKGADIYVCGNKAGMGDGVHRILTEYLGLENVSALLTSGRYRRDLY
ncbi:NADPH cytochrome P450 oxidoreductase family protein [Aliiglaciecola sp. SL4]|uniref:NADPH cytochrome P450 oxidoreductase family protein n=1 Tax=Aliiglaciecola sp. SL4 TaxID=3239806 RepID=UPI00355BB4BD